MTRLRAFACCLLLLTAGCSALVGTPEPAFEPVSVDQFVVQNVDDEPHTLHVSVVENGTVVYVDSFRLNGTYEGPKGTTAPGVILDPNPLAEPGNYTVGFRVDDGRLENYWLSEPPRAFGMCGDDQSNIFTLESGNEGRASVGVGCGSR